MVNPENGGDILENRIFQTTEINFDILEERIFKTTEKILHFDDSERFQTTEIRKRRNKPSTTSIFTTTFTTIQSSEDLPSRSQITSTPSNILNSTKNSLFKVEPSESEKGGDTFRKASFFPSSKQNKASQSTFNLSLIYCVIVSLLLE